MLALRVLVQGNVRAEQVEKIPSGAACPGVDVTGLTWNAPPFVLALSCCQALHCLL